MTERFCVEILASKHNFLSFADAISNDGELARSLLAWCETTQGSDSRESETFVHVDLFRMSGTGFSKELRLMANVSSSIPKCGESPKRVSMDALVVLLIPAGSFVDLNELASRFDAGARMHFSDMRIHTLPSNSDSEAMAELAPSMLLLLEVLDVLVNGEVGTQQNVCDATSSKQEKTEILLDLSLPIHLRYHAAASPDDFAEARNVSFSFPLILSKTHSAVGFKGAIDDDETSKNRIDIKSSQLFDTSYSYRLSTCISESCMKPIYALAPVGSLAHNDLVPFVTLATIFSTFVLLLMLIFLLPR